MQGKGGQCAQVLSQHELQPATQGLVTGWGLVWRYARTWGAGANHWLGVAGAAAPAAGVAALRKFWLEVLPSLRSGVSCMAGGTAINKDVLRSLLARAARHWRRPKASLCLQQLPWASSDLKSPHPAVDC